jgi:hypothetical protein
MEDLASIVFDFKVWVTIALGILLNTLVSHSPRLIRGYWKGRRLEKLKKIRRVRPNQAEVTYEIAKANSYFLFFLITCLMYLIFLIMGPLGETAKQSKLLLAIIVSPLYVVEVLWLVQDKYAKQLVRASRCIHVTSHARRTR